MPIVPDTKDWTWVLERRCGACGFDASTLPATDVSRMIRENAARWPALLNHPSVRARPDDSTWSGLEYACHVRDVFRLYDRRLEWMLTEDDPTFADWDQDATAVEDCYSEQGPDVVARDLLDAGSALADSFEAVPAPAWGRTGNRSDGAHFTIDTFARYLIHDPIHHVWDVEQGYAVLAAGA